MLNSVAETIINSTEYSADGSIMLVSGSDEDGEGRITAVYIDGLKNYYVTVHCPLADLQTRLDELGSVIAFEKM